MNANKLGLVGSQKNLTVLSPSSSSSHVTSAMHTRKMTHSP